MANENIETTLILIPFSQLVGICNKNVFTIISDFNSSVIYFFCQNLQPRITFLFMIFFFPDGHLKVTECSSSHSRQALCCKMAAEFDAFLDSGKK